MDNVLINNKKLLKIQKIAILSIIFMICALWCTTFFFVDFKEYTSHIFLYLLAVLVPISIIGLFGTMSLIKGKSKNLKQQIIIFWATIVFIFIMILYFSFWKSRDYTDYLKHWYDAYASLSVKDALYKIVDVSNYTPFYNYFLIVIAKLGVNSLLGIKFITFCFSILLAISMELLVCHIKNCKFNYLRMVAFIAIPSVCVEYASWGQCDAIYTSFCLLSLYFALKKKSKLSFLFVGLAFATKMQFLFIVPILFIMLIIKDENGDKYLKWKHIWIAPVMYFVNFLPVLFGRPILDVLTVYFRQVNEYGFMSANAGNICQIYNLIGITQSNWIYKPLVYFHTFVTLVLLVLLLIFIMKIYKNKKTFTDFELCRFALLISLIMVYFMPKMHDRFFYIPVMLGFVYLCSSCNYKHLLMALMLEFSLLGTMLGFYMKSISTTYLIIASVAMVFAVIFNFIVIVLLSLELKNSYSNFFKRQELK